MPNKTILDNIATLPFRFGKKILANSYLTYLPDSLATFKLHPEFDWLLEPFSRHNRLNNAGDTPRLVSFILNIKQTISDGISGDYAELGVWRGNTAAVLAHYAKTEGKKLYLFDTFEGFDSRDLKGVDQNIPVEFDDPCLDVAKKLLGESSSCCEFIKGYFPESLKEAHNKINFSVVSLDCDLYEPMKAGLEFFYPRMSKGGLLMLHDYSSGHWPGAKKAIDEFCALTGEYLVLLPDKSGSAFVRKSKS